MTTNRGGGNEHFRGFSLHDPPPRERGEGTQTKKNGNENEKKISQSLRNKRVIRPGGSAQRLHINAQTFGRFREWAVRFKIVSKIFYGFVSKLDVILKYKKTKHKYVLRFEDSPLPPPVATVGGSGNSKVSICLEMASNYVFTRHPAPLLQRIFWLVAGLHRQGVINQGLFNKICAWQTLPVSGGWGAHLRRLCLTVGGAGVGAILVVTSQWAASHMCTRVGI